MAALGLLLLPSFYRSGGRRGPHLLRGIEAQLLDISQEAEESSHLLTGHGGGQVRDLDDGRGAQGEAQRHPDASAVHHGGACTTALLAAMPHTAQEADLTTQRSARRLLERPRARAL